MANTFRLFTFFLLVSFIYMGDILGNTQHKPFKLKAVDSESGKVEGILDIKGEKHNAVCDCGEDNQEPNQSKVECAPLKIKLRKEKDKEGASITQVGNIIGKPWDMKISKIAKESFKCTDGRTKGDYLATPGGDTGEFLLALHVYSTKYLTNTSLTQERVEQILHSYLKAMKPTKFYMCSDDTAIGHLEKVMEVEGIDLDSPREQDKVDLLKYLIQSENVGDLHLRLMLKYPQKYAVESELIENYVTSFFNILWNKTDEIYKKIHLDILTGDHSETAFLEILLNEDCKKLGQAPLTKGKNKDLKLSAFVNHIDAVSRRRKQLAKFFTETLTHHTQPINTNEFFEALEHLGMGFLEITGSYIAKNIPFYTATMI